MFIFWEFVTWLLKYPQISQSIEVHECTDQSIYKSEFEIKVSQNLAGLSRKVVGFENICVKIAWLLVQFLVCSNCI